MSGDPQAQEPVYGGVELSRYATVNALLSEDVPLAAALEHVGLDESRWLEAQEPWSRVLFARQLSAEGSFARAALEGRAAAALLDGDERARWERWADEQAALQPDVR